MTAAAKKQQVVDTTCSSLLHELELIWDEVGESDAARDTMLLQLEQECLEVYRRKVDQANKTRASLHQALADSEAELARLCSALGDGVFISPAEIRAGTLKEQLGAIAPQLEQLHQKKEDRTKQFMEVKSQIRKISGEISGSSQNGDAESFSPSDEPDLSLRRLEDYQAQLQSLLKEKSDRLHKVLDCINAVHNLCAVLGLDFFKMVTEVHPSLDESGSNQPKSISNDTLNRLAHTIQSLQEEKRRRLQKLQGLGSALLDLWNLMDTPSEEQHLFQSVTRSIGAADSDVVAPNALAYDIIEEAEVEVERLERLKASKMKELVLKKRIELEEICRNSHMEPDASTAQDVTNAFIDSGMVDASELLASIEDQISKAKEAALSRKEILDKIDKWMAACEEESWLEDYNKDENRYNASKGAHINLKRAERARVTVTKLPALVESLSSKTRAWEDERCTPFLFDGVRLLAMLEEYNFLRQEKEEEKRRLRDQKRLQEQFMTEQETLFGSRPSPNKVSNGKRSQNGGRTNGNHAAANTNRRLSLGGAMLQPSTPDLVTPRVNGVTPSRGKDNKKERSRPSAPVNYVALPKEDTASLSSGAGSDPTSPQAD
ncbi:hypothetical protein O6H91_08G021000 [Diphasiastrum complanatum]|uniref:Uncharacterized protein n=1 Tax=Diphasiastrum complanatum TaxID=34168 RepID=A0ACC2CVI3_DIPCM|nr:hypothetical protein O6H91_08G021000 [Diphasiastrum complanatum]